MAKLKAPLMSLGASGQLGKALVFFPWKGLDVVREYIIPSNPKSTLQQAQRGYLRSAVIDIHAAQADTAHPLDETDATAYALWASVVQPATTWFNQAVRHWLDRVRAHAVATVFKAGSTAPTNTTLVVQIYSGRISATWLATGKFMWGTSKTALINTQGATPDTVNQKMDATIPGLSRKTKYYWQFEGLTAAAYLGIKSGIYHGTTT